MMRSARLLAAIVIAILALPHPHLFAKPRPLLPVLRIDVQTVDHACAGPGRVRVFFTFVLKNVGGAAAVRPSQFTPWYAIQDGRNPVGGTHALPPDQLLPKEAVTFKDQAVFTQVPVPLLPNPPQYDIFWQIMADPANVIAPSKLPNGTGGHISFSNKPIFFPVIDFNPGRCK
jgi:hypothetical protein